MGIGVQRVFFCIDILLASEDEMFFKEFFWLALRDIECASRFVEMIDGSHKNWD